MDARDAKVYRSIALGDQCWLRDNLDIGTMIESTQSGSQAHDDGVVEKYCWDNDPAECDGSAGMKRGGFYEWIEVLQGDSGQPIQGICPDGFHLPSGAEWDVLLEQFAGGSNCDGELAAGGPSGFDALMTGYRCTLTGGFRPGAMSADYRAHFWTSDTTTSGEAWLWEIGEGSAQTFDFDTSLGLSVRCIGDAAS